MNLKLIPEAINKKDHCTPISLSLLATEKGSLGVLCLCMDTCNCVLIEEEGRSEIQCSGSLPYMAGVEIWRDLGKHEVTE